MTRNELASIADDPAQRSAFIRFWGDEYNVAAAALKTMKTLLLSRLADMDIEIARVKAEIRAEESNAGDRKE